MKYNYIVDLDERGMFHAHVEDENENIVYSISNENPVYDDETGEEIGSEYGVLQPVQDGFMKHSEDVDGLESYLIDMGVISKDSILSAQN